SIMFDINFKNKYSRYIFSRLNIPFICGPTLRFGSYFNESFQKLLNSEIIDGTTKENRCQVTRTIQGNIKWFKHGIHKLHLVPQCLSSFISHDLVKLCVS